MKAPRSAIAWLGGGVIAAIVALAATDIVRSHRQAVAETERELLAQSRVIAEQTARSLQAIDGVLRQLAERLQQGDLADADAQTVHRHLKEFAPGLVQADGLVVFNIDGSLRAVSHMPPDRMPPAVFAGQPPFERLRGGETGLMVDNAVKSPGTGLWVFPIGRRLLDRQGRFAGAVGAPGRVDYYQNFWRDAFGEHGGAGLRIALLHRRGWLLARHPASEAALGRQVTDLEALLAPEGQEPRVSRFPSPVDGVDHYAVARAVPEQPLVVVVSRDADTALAAWREQAWGSALRTLALAALAAALLGAVYRQLARLRSAQRSLEVSRERYALAAAGADDGIWDWDLARGQAYESRRARELQGLPLEPETQPIAELRTLITVHPDDAPRREAALQAHLRGETPAYEIEYRTRRNGSVADAAAWRWIHVRALCIRDAEGRATRIAGSVTDVDARRRAEQALRESEQRFAVAVAGSDDGIWDWNFATGLVYNSPRGRRMVGVALAQDHVPMAQWQALMAERVHPDDAAQRQAAMDDHLAGRTPAYACEFRMRHDDGQYRWVRVHGTCVRDAEGRPLRMAGSVSDVDHRRRAEEALRESEARYALAMTGSHEGHWVWDLAAAQVFVSAAHAELLGMAGGAQVLAADDYFGRLPVHPDDAARVHGNRERHVRGETPLLDHEFRIVHPGSGQVRWLHSRAQCFRDEQGRPQRLAGATVDVTARKHAEAERERLEGQLRQAQKLEAIGTLAGGIAHDFNNILSAILGYGELAQRDAPPGTPLARHVDAAMSAAQRARSLVQRILAFSRSGIGERVPVPVQAVVQEALTGVRATLPLEVVLEPRLEAGRAGLLGDPTQIHQVVLNLAANAVHAMRGKGRLAVTLDTHETTAPLPLATCTLPPGRWLRLVVADTGSGIEPHVLERLFDPFFTTKEVGVGTGLGLSLVHGIVTDLGGGIAVESRPGAGATFTVHLPWSCDVDPAAAAAPLPQARGDGQAVLLVDDEEPLVRLNEELLADLGYEPVGYTSGAAALAALREDPQRFALLLSDENMPGLTGTELARAARALRPALPVVLMSGYVSPALLARAREAGVAEVLAKPLASREIARCLAGLLTEAPA